jgi:hypothetical protein
MTTVAVETALELAPLRVVRAEPVLDDPWELHSELVLVCPELRRRSLELLPERDPDAFLVGPRAVPLFPERPLEEREAPPRLAVAIGAYAVWRLAQTARSALLFAGGLTALVALAALVR